jgi:hypothetical protein
MARRPVLARAVANAVARLAVVALVRPGGQAQFIDAPVASTSSTTLDRTREWAPTRLQDQLTLGGSSSSISMSSVSSDVARSTDSIHAGMLLCTSVRGSTALATGRVRRE